MATFVSSPVYGAGLPPPQTVAEKSVSIPSLDRGAPYFTEPGVTYRDESHHWVVGRAFDQVPPTDIHPVLISMSMIDGDRKPTFYVVLRGSRVGILLDSAIATSFTNGMTDGYKFKSRSQVHAVQEFNRFNALGEVKICRARKHSPQVIITANWRIIVGTLALLAVGYLYLLSRA